jgi:hypothetical protein
MFIADLPAPAIALDEPPRDEIAQCGCDAAKKPKGKSGADKLPDNGRPTAMRFTPWRKQFHRSRGKADGDATDCGTGGVPRLHRRPQSIALRYTGCPRMSQEYRNDGFPAIDWNGYSRSIVLHFAAEIRHSCPDRILESGRELNCQKRDCGESVCQRTGRQSLAA